MIKNKKTDITVEAHGSVELEQIVKDKIHATISNELDALAKKYYRDIKVDVIVTVK